MMLSPFIQPFSKIWWKGVWQLHWEGQKCQIIAFLPEQRAPIIEYSACKDLSHFSWQPSLFFRSPPTLCSCLYRKWEGSVCRALRTNSVCMGVCVCVVWWRCWQLERNKWGKRKKRICLSPQGKDNTFTPQTC